PPPTRQSRLRLTLVDGGFFLYFVGGSVLPVLALLARGGEISTSTNWYGQNDLQLLLGPLQFYLLYRIIVASFDDERQVARGVMLLLISTAIVSALGIMQKAGVAGVPALLDEYFPTVSQGYEI